MMSEINKRISHCIIFIVLVSASCSRASAFMPVSDGAVSRLRLNKTSFPKTMKITNNIRGGNISPTARPAALFDNGLFWQTQTVFVGLNSLGLLISLSTGSHLHLDLLGTGAFAAAATVPFFSGSPVLLRVKLSSIAVFTWGLKLAGFLFLRVLKVKKDARLTDTLSSGSGATMFWVISALWGVICSLPFTLGATSSAPGNPTSIKVGAAMYFVGLITESVADYQKWAFKQSNPGQFCDVGLWSMSQHPNFFGNLLIWTGIFIMNVDSLVDPEATTFFAAYKRVGLALLSPLFMYAWFYGQASGAVSNTVQLFQERYSKQPGYQDYVDNVPLIFPRNPFTHKS
jgi:steroid 5-alpha reductase family enzyme